jgi:hypothetical protein
LRTSKSPCGSSVDTVVSFASLPEYIALSACGAAISVSYEPLAESE